MMNTNSAPMGNSQMGNSHMNANGNRNGNVNR
jgi:hypothetical protein